jgi:hypothetical protein
MSLVVLVALGLLSFAVGLAAPMADLELRQGRAAFRALVVDAVARGGLTELERGGWLPSAISLPVGDSLVLPSITPRAGFSLRRRIARLGPNLWLGEAIADARDRGGSILAGARQGLLIRVGAEPPDTTIRARATSRPWIAGFQ